ncbi:hypothetical protein I5I23_23320 [Pseudomonas aeruginosa]|jgi:acyl-CoA dehydrogenase|nr:hypothetical protein [Pseudomonas aeruginosa]
MVDFSLTHRDKQLVDIAREDAMIARKYARYYDRHHEELEPIELPEAKGRPDPYAMLKEDPTGTSGQIGVVSRKPRNFRQPINMACLALGR